MNNTPLYSALKKEAQKQNIRFHMPGHGGKKLFSGLEDIYEIDYTETFGTGNLYEGEEPILSAEKSAANYFKSKEAFFVTGGSTQGICAALMIAKMNGSDIIIDRNCHKSAINAIALLDLNPHFIVPEISNKYNIPSVLYVTDAEKLILENPDVSAIFLTSPNYYGISQNIEAFATLCKKYNKLLIVDQAHGAHFPAISHLCATSQGADITVVSTHKTLPALGQTSVLLSNGKVESRKIRYALSIFGTSSPSYLLMSSIDLAISYIVNDERNIYKENCKLTTKLKDEINTTTIFRAITNDDFKRLDPLRLTISCKNTGYNGHKLSNILYNRYKIACEMADVSNLVFIINPSHTKDDFSALLNALVSFKRKDTNEGKIPTFSLPPKKMSIREAFFSKTDMVSLKNAEGEICAKGIIPYPPGVCVICPGEEITASIIEFLKKSCYNVEEKIYVISSNF